MDVRAEERLLTLSAKRLAFSLFLNKASWNSSWQSQNTHPCQRKRNEQPIYAGAHRTLWMRPSLMMEKLILLYSSYSASTSSTVTADDAPRTHYSSARNRYPNAAAQRASDQ